MLRQGNWHASWLWEWLWWLSFRICHFLPLVLIQHPRTDIIIHTTQKYENEKIFNFWAFVPTPICTCASLEVICYPTGDARHCTLASLWNMKKPTNILDMRQPWKRSANHFLVYAVSTGRIWGQMASCLHRRLIFQLTVYGRCIHYSLSYPWRYQKSYLGRAVWFFCGDR